MKRLVLAPFFYDDGRGHAVMIRRWLPYGHSRRVVILAAIAGALLLPTLALGATVSPEKQAFMDRQGWSATDEDSETAYPLGAGPTGNCAHGRARTAASALRYKSGNPMVRGGVKLALCANNGNITEHSQQYRHASPGRYWKSTGIGADTHSEWVHGGHFRATGTYYWLWDTPSFGEFNKWWLRVSIEGRVKRGTDHILRFDVRREWH